MQLVDNVWCVIQPIKIVKLVQIMLLVNLAKIVNFSTWVIVFQIANQFQTKVIIYFNI